MTREERFAKKVRRGLPADCWEWAGTIDKSGYGKFRLGEKIGAHRASWILHNGPIEPDTLQVCHTCDNRRCVNPAHLFLGTAADNIRDCWKKGRAADRRVVGRARRSTKLNAKKVTAIRWLLGRGFRQRDIAHMFCVSRHHVSAIKRGKKWADVEDPTVALSTALAQCDASPSAPPTSVVNTK